MIVIHQVKEDIKKLARLAASLSEAHTAAIFLPTGLLTGPTHSLSSKFSGAETNAAEAIHLTQVVSEPPPRSAGMQPDRRGSVELAGAHSLSTCLTQECRIPVGTGLLGWVAENARPIHVSPFDMDSSSLGIYSGNESIKSLVAVPIVLPPECGDPHSHCGVLMCDSRNPISFCKNQIKLLEEIAIQVARLAFWALYKKETSIVESSWQTFTYQAERLAEAIGTESVELLRIAIPNFSVVESALGLSTAVQQTEQFVRLIQQALPPHFPVLRLPNGEIIVALDNMMSAFFQQKIRSLASRPGQPERGFTLSITSHPAKGSRAQILDIDVSLKQPPAALTAPAPAIPSKVIGGGPRA